MNGVNRTLYIPLYGKAYVSRKGILLKDEKAEAIWAAEGFSLKGKSRSKWLAYYMGMRSGVFDRWTQECLAREPEAVVLHLGCGLDSRCLRVDGQGREWFDVDFPEVIGERRRFFEEKDGYHMVPADIRQEDWLKALPGDSAIVILEGVSMYLTPEELHELMARLSQRFCRVALLMDCYTVLAAKASRYKNPINDVGVTQVYGLDDPEAPIRGTDFVLAGRREMTPAWLTEQLTGIEGAIFRALYAGKTADKLYRLYEYHLG